ncbi:ATP-binding protein [Leptolyngbya sp. DQ-M1]|uniref:PAS domain-containing sensor histidine kinase n=1 Tax=Leptolyngbya sp. DQ-M1 TaxID=2933920 RepID=UPI0032994ED4
MSSNSAIEIDVQTIAANAPGAIFRLSAIGNEYRIDYISDRVADLVGVSAAVITKDFAVLENQIDPSDRDRFRESLRKAINRAIPWSFEGRVKQRWIQITAALTEINQSETIFCGMITEITRYKQSEIRLKKSHNKLITELSGQVAKLQQSQNLLKCIINNTRASIFAKEYRNTNGTYILMNREFAHRFNLDQDRDLGKTDYDFFPPEIAAAFQVADRAAIASGTSIQLEEIEPHEDGLHIAIVVKFPLFDETGQAFAIGGIATDITDLKRAKEALEQANEVLESRVAERTTELSQRNAELEATLSSLNQTQTQLIQSERMSSLGQLVAGIAHEVNNPVNFIHGNLRYADAYTRDLIRVIQLYQKHYPELIAEIQHTIDEIDLGFLLDDVARVFASMRTGTTRIQEIVKSLRSFSRLDEAALKTIDINAAIEQTLTLLQHRLKAQHITIVKHYGTVAPIDCYAGQLNQVWMNLINNAIDAIETVENRTIEIWTDQQSDQTVKVRIRDTGIGISAEIRPRIFDPFFTTKPVGKGTGMGLALSYQTIVEQHRGSIECFPVLPQGTEFIVKLPSFS